MRNIPAIILFFLLPAGALNGQYYDTGEDPGSLKWLHIKTGKFDVIYPGKYGKAGIDFAKSLERSHNQITSLFPEKRFRIPVVIHNYTVSSNGYVSWAPKRIELYPTPEQNSIPGDPFDQLTLHELTHVYQMESLRKGFSSVMNVILGEQYTGIVSSLLPLWYLEGDAVFSETFLSRTGRGRSPAFVKELKAVTSGPEKLFKYDKILNGSFRDNVPDHYQYGYEMVTWAKAKHDPDIWNKVISFTAKEPFTLNPVNISLNRNARLTKRKLYYETFDTLKSIWSREKAKTPAEYEPLNPSRKNDYINYYSPVSAGKDSIIAIRTSLSDAPSFVLINTLKKTEKKIYRPGYMFPWLLSYSSGKLLWVESRQDPRWQNREFSDIYILSLRSGRVQRLTHHSRYLGAALSPDGMRIAAVENTSDNRNNLVLIDALSGSVIKSVPSPENRYLQRPQWGDRVTVIYLTDNIEGIMSFSPAENRWDNLLEGNNDLQSAFLRGDSLFYVSSVTGTENIFMKLKGAEARQLTNSRFGATDINVSGKRIFFSDYSRSGNSACSIETGVHSVRTPGNRGDFLINRFEKKEEHTAEPDINYTPEPYRKWQHLFRFHSWFPFYADIEQLQSDPLAIRPGAEIMSQNSLSTLISSFGYEYTANKENVFHSNITWKGWYPVFESRLDYGYNPVVFGKPVAVMSGLRFSNSVYVPLYFSRGWFFQFLRPSLTTEYTNNIYQKPDHTYDYNQVNLKARVYFSNSSRMSLRDIYPRWAQTADLNYIFAPWDRNIFGSSAFFRTAFYFPGLFRDDGFRLKLEAEKQNQSGYIFSNRISFPRAYSRVISNKLKFASADYVVPLVYPDFNISSIFYLKRIRTGIFYDYASGKGNWHFNRNPDGSISRIYNRKTETFQSFGTQILGDFHLFRIPFMISGGVQAAWKDIYSAPQFELLFNMDLYGMTIGRR